MWQAICEAVTRPNMRFVPIKTEDQQAVLMTHRARDFLVRQLTQITNSIRAHLGEFGIVAPKGIHNVERLLAMAEAAVLPDSARKPILLLADQFRDTHRRIDNLTADIRVAANDDAVARRLQTIPGIGPITASAIAATCRKNGPPDRFLTLQAVRCVELQSRPRPGRVVLKARLRRDDRTDAEAAFKRRQGAAGEDIENGQPLPPPPALSRGDGGDHGPKPKSGR